MRWSWVKSIAKCSIHFGYEERVKLHKYLVPFIRDTKDVAVLRNNDKFYELYPEKKETPKLPRIKDIRVAQEYECEFIKAEEYECGHIKAEDAKIVFELKQEFLEQLENQPPITSVTSNHTTQSVATGNTGITKASPFKCFDTNSGKDAFFQIAEKVKNGTAQVSRVSLSVDAIGCFSYGKRITFEIYDYEP